METREIFENWIKEKEHGEYRIIGIEEEGTHALIECALPGIITYNLYEVKEGDIVRFIHCWEDIKRAQTAFSLFCHEDPEMFEQLNSANMQIALYDDENRKLKAIVKGMLEERYCKQ